MASTKISSPGEQTTNSILALKNRMIEESIAYTVIAFVVVGLGLLLFASRISSRIRSLRNQVENAISKDGGIVSTINSVSAKDEIGDLTRTLSAMLKQSQEQNEYRETMADNLEHEMRTPLAGISASLKNLIDNAVSFHVPGTPVSLSLTGNDRLELTVCNQGPEIETAVQGQRFNSMVSFRSRKKNSPHLGLGLYIVRSIVHHHGGTVRVNNMTGDSSGVCFEVFLPCSL